MKNLFFIVLASFCSFSFSACEKNPKDLTNKCFTIKILDEICGNAVVQIVNEEFYALGVNGYQSGGVTYNHVFTTIFSCADLSKMSSSATSLRGLQLKVKITDKHEDDPYCTRCAATIANAPQKLLLLKVSNDCK